MTAVAPLILAAGGSTRMGRPKAALAFGEHTALGLILSSCQAAGLTLAHGVVVAGADPEAVRGAAAAHPEVRVVTNPRWAKGRATSIRAGLEALDRGAEAFLLWPVDVCLPGPELIRALLRARAEHPDALAWVPSHDRRRGHPILLSREVGPRLQSLQPDQPAREVTRAIHAEGRLHHVETDDATVLMNMNQPADYQRWLDVYLTAG